MSISPPPTDKDPQQASPETKKWLAGSITAVSGVVGFIASIVQLLTTKRIGIWLLLGVLGLAVIIVAFRLLRTPNRNLMIADVAVGLAVVGTIFSLVALAGATNVLPSKLWSVKLESSDASAPSPGPAPTTPSTATDPSTTGGGEATLPVGLKLNENDGALPLSVTVTVNRPADSGRRYWLLLRVAYSSTDVEFYGQQPLKAGPAESERVTLQIPTNAILETPRKAVVWTVPPDIDKQLQGQQKQDLANRTPLFQAACPDCEASDPLSVTPLS